MAAPLAVTREGTTLAGEVAGSGPAVLALHGLTATRRYVLMGSRALERGGHTVIAYDARGHGASSRAAEGRYDYPALVADAATVLDAAGVERAVLAGVSMGAHTAVTLALAMPERVAGLALVTPAFDPQAELVTASWDALAGGLRSAGIEGFLAAYDFDGMPAQLARGRPAGDRTAPGGPGASRRACRRARTGAALAAVRAYAQLARRSRRRW